MYSLDAADRRARRIAKHRRYNASEKGRARNRRYDTTPGGIARKLLYEQTMRAAYRPRFACDVMWGCHRATFTSPLDPLYQDLKTLGVRWDFEDLMPESRRREMYREQIRRERQVGILSPLTFAQLVRQ